MKRTRPRDAGRGTHNQAGVDVGLLERAEENRSSLIDYQHLRSGAAAREARGGVAPTPPIHNPSRTNSSRTNSYTFGASLFQKFGIKSDQHHPHA